ncbi:MAG: VOC family protein [Actinomycetota bacterium]
MPVELSKDAIDLGIVVTDSESALGFYRDLLGFRHEGDVPMPVGSGVMHRLWCGDSLIKLVCWDETPAAAAPPGGPQAATGYRYWTMRVANLEGIMAECEAAGVDIVVPVTEVRPGVTIGMVNDPDGNVVEFVDDADD